MKEKTGRGPPRGGEFTPGRQRNQKKTQSADLRFVHQGRRAARAAVCSSGSGGRWWRGGAPRGHDPAAPPRARMR